MIDDDQPEGEGDNVVSMEKMRERIAANKKPKGGAKKGPMELAEAFLEGRAKLKLYAGSWWEYDAGRYVQRDKDWINSELWLAFPSVGGSRDISNIASAARAQAYVLDYGMSPPFWLKPAGDGREQAEAGDGLVLRNGLLDLKTRELKPISDKFFATSSLTYDWRPDMPTPVFDEWLDTVLQGDKECIELALQMLGTLVLGDTSSQSLFVVVGKSNSGKSTLSKLVEDLVGREAITASTVQDLGSPNGLENLVGKKLCILSDIRTGSQRYSKTDSTLAVQRILTITGGDIIHVPMRYSTTGGWSGTLKTNMLLIANEIPKFSDTAGAMLRRLRVLEFKHQIAKADEKVDMPDMLRAELPGILGKVLDAYDRLKKCGNKFVVPVSTEAVMAEAAGVFDYVRAFVQECCEVDGSTDSFVGSADLHSRFVQWAKDNGIHEIGATTLKKRVLKLDGRLADGRLDVYNTTIRGIKGMKLLPGEF